MDYLNIEENQPDLLTELNQKEIKFLNFFWLGFAVYSITAAFVTQSHIIILILQVFQMISLLSMFYGAIHLIKYKFDNDYLAIIFTFYLLWLLIIFAGVYKFFNYSFFKSSFLGAPSGPLLYFAPLVLLFPRKLGYYKKLFDVIIIFGIFYVLFDFIFIKHLLSSDSSDKRNNAIVETLSDLSFPCGFILLTLYYHSTKKQLISMGVVLLALLFALIRARRGLIVMYSEILLFGYIIYFFTSRSKVLIIYLTIIVFIGGLTYYFHMYRPHESKVFGFLLERGDEDTRTGVELYFYDDMKTKDWIVGRGVKGEYFCPDIEEDQATNYRDTIETGYLQTILNGGLISLGLFLLIAIPAFIKGIFSSRNILSKAAGLWILMSIVNSYPATINVFTLNYLLVWISIGICYSKEIRYLSEPELRQFFNPLHY
ncbi:MAG: hypothetical protein ACTHOB_18640 [Ginsengibacter sp.]